jgi:syntaxin 18
MRIRLSKSGMCLRVTTVLYQFLTTVHSTAESSLLEISELQTQLATNLVTQNVHIDNLIMDSLATTENIQRGNKELKKASERTSIARSAFFGTVVFCSVVFVWDWFI